MVQVVGKSRRRNIVHASQRCSRVPSSVLSSLSMVQIKREIGKTAEVIKCLNRVTLQRIAEKIRI